MAYLCRRNQKNITITKKQKQSAGEKDSVFDGAKKRYMTGTTPINFSTKLYSHAADYARQHDTSVEKMTENFFLAFFVEEKKREKQKRHTHYSPELLKLVGIAKGANVSPDDLNVDEARWDYLKEKYNLR